MRVGSLHVRTSAQNCQVMTSRIKILTWCNILVNIAASPEILHVNRQFINNIFSSRPFLPPNRSRQFLSHIYSGQNDITFNGIVLFFPHEIDKIPSYILFCEYIEKYSSYSKPSLMKKILLQIITLYFMFCKFI